MKLAIFGNIAEKMRAHKLIAWILICVCAALAGAGCFYGYKTWQYRQTPEYAFEKIREALNPPDTTRLAKFVDFRRIGNEIAVATAKNFPFFMAGADQERAIAQIVQSAVLKNILAGADAKLAKPDAEESEEASLSRPLEILPKNFVAQLYESLNLTEAGKNGALIGARIDNPQFKKPFTLVFSLVRTPDGFRVERLVNANELVSQLRAAMLERFAALREVYEKKNAATAKQMEGILPIQSCTADAGLLGDGRTMIMVVHVLARNQSDTRVNNVSVDAEIFGQRGQLLLRRYLNAAEATPEGGVFKHRWNFEMEGSQDVARRLLSGGRLSCRARWQTLGLNNGKVLHIQEVPNQNIRCAKNGHNHPQGFCELPVFLK